MQISVRTEASQIALNAAHSKYGSKSIGMRAAVSRLWYNILILPIDVDAYGCKAERVPSQGSTSFFYNRVLPNTFNFPMPSFIFPYVSRAKLQEAPQIKIAPEQL